MREQSAYAEKRAAASLIVRKKAKKQRQKRLDERLRVQQVPLAEPTGELVVMQSNGHTYTAGHTVLARLGNATSSRGARYVHATSDMGFTSQVIPQL